MRHGSSTKVTKPRPASYLDAGLNSWCSAGQEVMTKRFSTLVTPAAFQAVRSA
jgi:hypothetical protein